MTKPHDTYSLDEWLVKLFLFAVNHTDQKLLDGHCHCDGSLLFFVRKKNLIHSHCPVIFTACQSGQTNGNRTA